MPLCGSPRPWPRMPQVSGKPFSEFKVQRHPNMWSLSQRRACFAHSLQYPSQWFTRALWWVAQVEEHQEQSEETSDSLCHLLKWRLGFCIYSLGDMALFTEAPSLVYYRVLISNLGSVLEAQLDSRVYATGHSYEKYNDWETVRRAHDLHRYCFGNWTKNVTLIHKWFHLVDRGLDSTNHQWKSRPRLSQCHRNHIFRKQYIPPQGNPF